MTETSDRPVWPDQPGENQWPALGVEPETEWIPTNVGTYNVRLGYALTDGDLGWLIKRFPLVSQWYLQEVPSRRDLVRALERAGVRDQWRVLSPRSRRRGLPHMIVKRRRYKLLEFKAPLMASFWARARSTMVLEDRKTGRFVGGSNLHPDPMGKGWTGASKGSRAAHSRQVGRHVQWLGRWNVSPAQKESLLISAGDTNEDLDGREQRIDPRTVTQQMKSVGLTPAWRLVDEPGKVHLDDVFVRHDRFVKVQSRTSVRTPSKRADHEAVIVRMLVAKVKR